MNEATDLVRATCQRCGEQIDVWGRWIDGLFHLESTMATRCPECAEENVTSWCQLDPTPEQMP